MKIFAFILIISLYITSINSTSMKEVAHYLNLIHSPSIHSRTIIAYGGKNWKYKMHPSVFYFLFEDFNVKENIAPKGNPNRPGDKHEKVYICVHDTGDWKYNAFGWSENVRRAAFPEGTPYDASFQYVVGNDGIYHNIPDDETAYHAGDGAREGSWFREYESGVYEEKEDNNNNIKVEIDDNGYYVINSKKSKILAPRNSTDGSILKTKDINDLGIWVRLNDKDKQYYIGSTWYSSTYLKIANHGGNTNSIGIETCINENSDIFLTWQKSAKLVAHLMQNNHLDISRVVQHHYFSGKNCPQTIRTINYWKFFLNLVEVEKKMLDFQNEGYKFIFDSKNKEYLDNNGRVIKTPAEGVVKVNYSVTIQKGEDEMVLVFTSLIEAYKETEEEEIII